MIGAALGDMIGSPYEFEETAIKTKNFPLFGAGSRFTDDTVMTAAVAEGLMSGYKNEDISRRQVVFSMRKWGKRYPDAGYGRFFKKWLESDWPRPYGSMGNGAAMRVSSAAWIYDTIENVEKYAKITAEVTHDHPEAIKGACAAASAAFLARKKYSKQEIRKYIESKYGYDLKRRCDDIRSSYRWNATCQGTVPQAIISFLDGYDFVDVIRNAVSLGGDSDTLAAIAGSIAEGFFGVPKALHIKAHELIDKNILEILESI